MVDARHVKIKEYSAEEDFQNAFPIPCRVILSWEPEMNCIIRFRTFYLKIYYHMSSRSTYIVQGGLYYNRDLAFTKEVPIAGFQEFAQTFTADDCLQCWDPNHQYSWEPYDPVEDYKKKSPHITWR